MILNGKNYKNKQKQQEEVFGSNRMMIDYLKTNKYLKI